MIYCLEHKTEEKKDAGTQQYGQSSLRIESGFEMSFVEKWQKKPRSED